MDASKAVKEACWCHCKAVFYQLKGHGVKKWFEKTEKWQMSYIYSRRAQGESRELQAHQPDLNPWKYYQANPPEDQLQPQEGQEGDLDQCPWHIVSD